MNIKNIILLCGSLLATTALLSSCSNDKTYDFPGDAYNRIYFDKPNVVSEGAIVCTPVGYIADMNIKFSVKSLRASTTKTKVSLKIDNSFVDTYNKTNNTSYQSTPDGTVTLENSILTIPADTIGSIDSVSIVVPESAYETLSNKAGYLVPVVISSAEGDGVAPSTNMGVKYLHIIISDLAIKKNVASSDIAGTLITDYSTWTGSSDTGTASTFANMFTSSNYSGWTFSANPSTAIIDMKEVKNLTGFKLMSQYGNYGQNFAIASLNVAISTDGNTYTDCGTLAYADMTNESGFQVVCFYGAMPCRYLKLIVKFNYGYSYYWKLVHFGAYTK